MPSDGNHSLLRLRPSLFLILKCMPNPNHQGRRTVQLALRLRYVTLMLLLALI